MSDENGNPFNLPSFRAELSALLDEKLHPITKMVADHEAALNRAKGARWAIGIIWGLATVIWEWFAHAGHK